MRTTIREISHGVFDGPHATPPPSETGAVFLGIGAIGTDGYIDESKAKRISEEDFPKWTRRVTPQAGDIVFSYEATLNLYAIIPSEFRGCLGRRIGLIRPDTSKVNTKFLFYYFYSPQWRSLIKSKIVQGATVDRISIEDFPDFSLELPSLETQKRIVQILEPYDSLIENNRRQIKLLEEAAQRLYKEWFVDLRFPGHEHTPIIDGIPQGWTECKIKDACLKIFSGGTPSRKKTAYWQGGQIPWFKTKELTDSWLIQSEERITEDALAASSAKIHLRGTILMAIYASPTLGRLGILDCDATCNQAALGLLANPDVCSEMWLFLKLMELRSDFNALARGAGQQNISADVVKNTSVVLPGNGVMKCFSELVNPIYGRILRAQKQMLFLSEARDRLLPKLMSGEVEV